MTGFNTQLSAECISLLNLVMALSSCCGTDKQLWSKYAVRIFSDTGEVCKIIHTLSLS